MQHDPTSGAQPTSAVTCVEIGGSGVQTVVFDEHDRFTVHSGAQHVAGATLLIACPGLIDGNRVVSATNLAWTDVDPAAALHLPGPARLVLNDAEAAAFGERALRADRPDLVYIGLGTGVGAAVVREDRTHANLLGHEGEFGTIRCRCGRRGCLETVAAGWALPQHLSGAGRAAVADALARALDEDPRCDVGLVVLGGGIVGSHPDLIELLDARLGGARVEPTAAPAGAKSAAAWGLRAAYAANGQRV